MRYRSSIPFVGLLLVGTAFAVAPMFVTKGPLLVSGNPATDSSWDMSQSTATRGSRQAPQEGLPGFIGVSTVRSASSPW